MSQVLDRTRIQDIDALRGFALLGILVVNITFAASGFPIHLAKDPAYDSWLEPDHDPGQDLARAVHRTAPDNGESWRKDACHSPMVA